MNRFFLFLLIVSIYFVGMFVLWARAFFFYQRTKDDYLDVDPPSLEDINLDIVAISVLYILFYIIGFND